MKKGLSIILFLSALMALMLGSMCLLAYPKALEMLKFTDSPDVFQAVTLFGVCLVPLSIFQVLAGYWTWNSDFHGIILARFCGLLILFDGIMLYTILHRPDLSIADIAKGILITILAFLCKRDR